MNFDVVIGNPPYQERDGGRKAATRPIYQRFIDLGKLFKPRYLSLLIPARWYTDGKGLNEFRSEMLRDDRLRQIHDFPDARRIFPGVKIRGGICYFLWERDNPGLCRVRTYENHACVSDTERPLLEEGLDLFIRFNEAVPILHKVRAHGESSFVDLVSARLPFGLNSHYFGNPDPFPGAIKLYQRGGVGYVRRDVIRRNMEWVDAHKVLVSRAYDAGEKFPHKVINTPFYAEPDSACTETYLVIGPFASKTEAENVLTYVTTKFFRFLVLLHKNSQHNTRRVFGFVPMQDFSKPWSDAELYAKYALTQDEIAFIERMVRSMKGVGP